MDKIIHKIPRIIIIFGHVKDHHRGLIQKGCQLNKPPWLGWILFINDEVEEAFCYSDEDLDESILTNCLI